MRLTDFILILIFCGFIQCRRRPTRIDYGEYTVNDDISKAYKVMRPSLPWDDAMLKCVHEGGKLAVPKSEQEFKTIQQLVRRTKYFRGKDSDLLVWVGISNKDTSVSAENTVWTNVDGENINETGFNEWSGGNGGTSYSDNPFEPHCAAVDGLNFGLRDFWCHRSLPYICEKSL